MNEISVSMAFIFNGRKSQIIGPIYHNVSVPQRAILTFVFLLKSLVFLEL